MAPHAPTRAAAHRLAAGVLPRPARGG